jgi:hypothetical protein
MFLGDVAGIVRQCLSEGGHEAALFRFGHDVECRKIKLAHDPRLRYRASVTSRRPSGSIPFFIQETERIPLQHGLDCFALIPAIQSVDAGSR